MSDAQHIAPSPSSRLEAALARVEAETAVAEDLLQHALRPPVEPTCGIHCTCGGQRVPETRRGVTHLICTTCQACTVCDQDLLSDADEVSRFAAFLEDVTPGRRGAVAAWRKHYPRDYANVFASRTPSHARAALVAVPHKGGH